MSHHLNEHLFSINSSRIVFFFLWNAFQNDWNIRKTLYQWLSRGGFRLLLIFFLYFLLSEIKILKRNDKMEMKRENFFYHFTINYIEPKNFPSQQRILMNVGVDQTFTSIDFHFIYVWVVVIVQYRNKCFRLWRRKYSKNQHVPFYCRYYSENVNNNSFVLAETQS